MAFLINIRKPIWPLIKKTKGHLVFFQFITKGAAQQYLRAVSNKVFCQGAASFSTKPATARKPEQKAEPISPPVQQQPHELTDDDATHNVPLVFIAKTKEIIDLTGLDKQQFYDSFSKRKDDVKGWKRILEDVRLFPPKVDTCTSNSEVLSGVSHEVQDIAKADEPLKWQHLPGFYMKLSKIRLTGLVVLTTLAGYAIAPAPIEPVALLCVVLGTGLMSCSANSVNQVLEIPYDAQMARTKCRVLVRGQLSPLHVLGFALTTAIGGLSILTVGVNGLTGILGAFNLFLYTSIYTPMKRVSIANTWVGSVVGAIPPMMGWAACTGALEPGAWILGAILYAWQFPHFNALSWNLRPDYAKAGYHMMSVSHPALCRRTAFSYSLVILGLCSAAPLFDLTTWAFVAESLPLNLYLVYRSWQFYQHADSATSRKLFRLSLVHLPMLLMLMFLSKKRSGDNDKAVVAER